MNAIAIELAHMAQRLRELFPESRSIVLDVSNECVELSLHRVTEEQGAAIMSRVAVSEPTTTALDHEGAVTIDGKTDGVCFCCFCREPERAKRGQPEAVV